MAQLSQLDFRVFGGRPLSSLINVYMTSPHMIGLLLEFYVLATSKVTSEWIPICDRLQVRRVYSTAPLGMSQKWDTTSENEPFMQKVICS